MRLFNALWWRFIAFRERHPRFVAWTARYAIFVIVILFIGLYSTISLCRHMQFQSTGFDLGIFDQHIWQLSRFEFGYNTVRDVPNLLGDHFHPILFLIVPAYWIWADPRMLLIIQAILVALGAVPVFYAVRYALRSSACALCLALTYLLFWGTLEMIFFDFHEMAFVGPILALSYLFIQRGKWVGYLLTIPFLLMIKETMALLVFTLGIYVILVHRKWFEGVSTCLISVGWFIAVTRTIMPPLIASSDYFYFKFYSHLGDNWIDAGWYLLSHPWMFVKELFVPHQKVWLWLFLLAPFLFLPLLSVFSILAIPPLLERLLSNNPNHWATGFHYYALFAPIFIFALLEVFPRLHRRLLKRGREVDYRKMVLALCVAILVLQLPFTFTLQARNLFKPSFYRVNEGTERTGYDILALIPPDASVSAQNAVVPHLTHRDLIFQFDGDTRSAEYVILNKFLNSYPLNDRTLVWELAKLYKDPRYVAHRFGYGWVVFTIKPEYDIDGRLQPFPPT